MIHFHRACETSKHQLSAYIIKDAILYRREALKDAVIQVIFQDGMNSEIELMLSKVMIFRLKFELFR